MFGLKLLPAVTVPPWRVCCRTNNLSLHRATCQLKEHFLRLSQRTPRQTTPGIRKNKTGLRNTLFKPALLQIYVPYSSFGNQEILITATSFYFQQREFQIIFQKSFSAGTRLFNFSLNSLFKIVSPTSNEAFIQPKPSRLM